MREANFKLGWVLNEQLAGLTHFHADVTQEDFMGVVQAGEQLLGKAKRPFHVLIDNRAVPMPAPVPLSQMKQMAPFMNHPLLHWVVVVKPEAANWETAVLPIEQDGDVQLKNVASLEAAVRFLHEAAPELDWAEANLTFFPNTNLAQLNS